MSSNKIDSKQINKQSKITDFFSRGKSNPNNLQVSQQNYSLKGTQFQNKNNKLYFESNQQSQISQKRLFHRKQQFKQGCLSQNIHTRQIQAIACINKKTLQDKLQQNFMKVILQSEKLVNLPQNLLLQSRQLILDAKTYRFKMQNSFKNQVKQQQISSVKQNVLEAENQPTLRSFKVLSSQQNKHNSIKQQARSQKIQSLQAQNPYTNKIIIQSIVKLHDKKEVQNCQQTCYNYKQGQNNICLSESKDKYGKLDNSIKNSQTEQNYQAFQGLLISQILQETKYWKIIKKNKIKQRLQKYQYNLLNQIIKFRNFIDFGQDFIQKCDQSFKLIEKRIQKIKISIDQDYQKKNRLQKKKKHFKKDKYSRPQKQIYYWEDQVQDIIIDQIDEFIHPNFDFSYKIVPQFQVLQTIFDGQQIFFQKQIGFKRFTTDAFIKFKCIKCSKSQGNQVCWASKNGLLQILYKFAIIYSKSMQLPFELQFNAKLYSQNCRKCKTKAKGKIAQNKMKLYCLKFCRKIIKFFKHNKEYRQDRLCQQRQKLDRNIQKQHKHQLCEACKLGKCPADGGGSCRKLYDYNRFSESQSENICYSDYNSSSEYR